MHGRAVDYPIAPILAEWMRGHNITVPPRMCEHRGSWIHWALPGGMTMPSELSRTPDCHDPAVVRWRFLDSRNPEHWNYACARHRPPERDGVITQPIASGLR